MPPEIKPGLIECIEQEMNGTSKAYFDTTLDFIKWNTAFAVAAILWFGNYLITAITNLNSYQSSLAVFTLLLFVGSIAYSIGFFYTVSRYFNQYWILCSQWRESVFLLNSPRPIQDAERIRIEVSNRLLNYYKNIPNKAKSFDTALIGQWVLLCFGFGCFIVFVISIKLQTP